MPVTIFKLLKFHDLTKKEFSLKWAQQADQIFKSENIELSSSVITRVNDFRRYFIKYMRQLILLNPESEQDFVNGLQDLHLGTVFSYMNGSEEYLLRVTVRPSKPFIAVFQVAQVNSQGSDERLMEYFIQTFAFLFSV